MWFDCFKAIYCKKVAHEGIEPSTLSIKSADALPTELVGDLLCLIIIFRSI